MQKSLIKIALSRLPVSEKIDYNEKTHKASIQYDQHAVDYLHRLTVQDTVEILRINKHQVLIIEKR